MDLRPFNRRHGAGLPLYSAGGKIGDLFLTPPSRPCTPSPFPIERTCIKRAQPRLSDFLWHHRSTAPPTGGGGADGGLSMGFGAKRRFFGGGNTVRRADLGGGVSRWAGCVGEGPPQGFQKRSLVDPHPPLSSMPRGPLPRHRCMPRSWTSGSPTTRGSWRRRRGSSRAEALFSQHPPSVLPLFLRVTFLGNTFSCALHLIYLKDVDITETVTT